MPSAALTLFAHRASQALPVPFASSFVPDFTWGSSLNRTLTLLTHSRRVPSTPCGKSVRVFRGHLRCSVSKMELLDLSPVPRLLRRGQLCGGAGCGRWGAGFRECYIRGPRAHPARGVRGSFALPSKGTPGTGDPRGQSGLLVPPRLTGDRSGT